MERYESGIEVGVDRGVGRITINRPGKLNTLTLEAQRRIISAAEYLNDQPALKVVVVSGASGSFTAGVDVVEFLELAADEGEVLAAGRLGSAMCTALEAIDVVTVASIRGHCIGGGVLLAAACDLRVAAEDTHFAIPEMRIGAPFTWGGIPRVMREMGPALTRELVMTGRPFSASEAHAAGFLNRVVPESDLDAEVERLVADLLEKSRSALVATKSSTRKATAALIDTSVIGDDARRLADALQDEESRRMAMKYLEQLD